MGSLFIFSVAKGKKVLKFCLQLPWKFKKFKVWRMVMLVPLVPTFKASYWSQNQIAMMWWEWLHTWKVTVPPSGLHSQRSRLAALPCLSAHLPAHAQWNGEDNWQVGRGLMLPLLLQSIPIDSKWEAITHSLEHQFKQWYRKSCTGAWRAVFFLTRSAPSVADAVSHVLSMSELFLNMLKFGHGKIQLQPQPVACWGTRSTPPVFPKRPLLSLLEGSCCNQLPLTHARQHGNDPPIY